MHDRSDPRHIDRHIPNQRSTDDESGPSGYHRDRLLVGCERSAARVASLHFHRDAEGVLRRRPIPEHEPVLGVIRARSPRIRPLLITTTWGVLSAAASVAEVDATAVSTPTATIVARSERRKSSPQREPDLLCTGFLGRRVTAPRPVDVEGDRPRVVSGDLEAKVASHGPSRKDECPGLVQRSHQSRQRQGERSIRA
jgi:hypothetical protein